MEKTLFTILIYTLSNTISFAQNFMTNVYGRNYISLNGKWNTIIDPYDKGEGMKIYQEKTPKNNNEFYEYSFDGGLQLNVPGDWNSQNEKLYYYEGTVWYSRHFNYKTSKGMHSLLYFSAVSSRCNIYLNGEKVKSHEGAFTPFEVDVTERIKNGDNVIVVEVNNNRRKDAIPAMAYDWWNYGGITRDVMIVNVPTTYIMNYKIQLDKHIADKINVSVYLSERSNGEHILLSIPELNIKEYLISDGNGYASKSIRVRNIQRWSPENPKLYSVSLLSDKDTVREKIGFRNINVYGKKVLINGKSTFLRSISFHEEVPQRKGRAYSESDAEMLVNAAKELGVNLIRLAHYPQNEYIVRLAEEKGIMLWEEIPIWQDIDFSNDTTLCKAKMMLKEMIKRDENRCAVCFWGIANETKPSKNRNTFLKSLLDYGKGIDTTRLYVAAFDLAHYDSRQNLFVMEDSFINNLDVVAINKYMGWYAPWPKNPKDIKWNVAKNKPLMISEFGGEALSGIYDNENVASSWSEDYQAKLYKDNLIMFSNIPNLCGISPWILFDFRSPFRFQPKYQNGWNRKGLISDMGVKKKAWFIIHDFYTNKTK